MSGLSRYMNLSVRSLKFTVPTKSLRAAAAALPGKDFCYRSVSPQLAKAKFISRDTYTNGFETNDTTDTLLPRTPKSYILSLTFSSGTRKKDFNTW